MGCRGSTERSDQRGRVSIEERVGVDFPRDASGMHIPERKGQEKRREEKRREAAKRERKGRETRNKSD